MALRRFLIFTGESDIGGERGIDTLAAHVATLEDARVVARLISYGWVQVVDTHEATVSRDRGETFEPIAATAPRTP